ncbi:MAG: nitroreductase/quinone reductase family protein [Micromonosporaceae bacterium]
MSKIRILGCVTSVKVSSPEPGADDGHATGGMPSHPGWYFNLNAHPEAEAEIFDGVRDPGRRLPGDGEKTLVRARELPAGEAAAFWPQVLQIAPQYATYRERAGRVIPLMRLVPVRGTAAPEPR